jgi:hypothetical protein
MSAKMTDAADKIGALSELYSTPRSHFGNLNYYET